LGEIIQQMVEELDNYFPEASWSDFKKLHHKNFNIEEMSRRSYEVDEIRNLATRFEMDKDKIVSQWQAFIYDVADRPDFAEMLNSQPKDFWSKMLRDCSVQAAFMTTP
jgi:hypothetical protein